MSAAGNSREDVPYLAARGLSKSFSNAAGAAVDDVDLDVGRGEMFGLLGPSGCGKSTTLNMLAGFLTPTSGTVSIEGRIVNDVPPHQRGTALVFQNYALFPQLTAVDNVAFGPRVRRVKKAQRRDRAMELLEMVGLQHLAGRYPAELSGGQQQRVAIARALAIDPQLILLDEPLSNLDARLRAQMRNDLRRLLRDAGVTAILVTHDQAEAFSVCDRVALMFDGSIAAVGRPTDLYLRPPDEHAASFIGEGTFLQGVVETIVDGSATVTLSGTDSAAPATLLSEAAAGAKTGVAGKVFVRPEMVRLSAPDDPQRLFDGEITDITTLGETVEYQVTCGFADVRHRTFAVAAPYRMGQRVGVSWTADDALFFAAESSVAAEVSRHAPPVSAA